MPKGLLGRAHVPCGGARAQGRAGTARSPCRSVKGSPPGHPVGSGAARCVPRGHGSDAHAPSFLFAPLFLFVRASDSGFQRADFAF